MGVLSITSCIVLYRSTLVYDQKIKYNDISEVDRESIKNNVTYVNQEVYLFHDSLYNNLVFGCKNVDYEKLGQVCELTGVSEIIESFTEGMAHILSAGGKNLSGGQRQKIALARALMRVLAIWTRIVKKCL